VEKFRCLLADKDPKVIPGAVKNYCQVLFQVSHILKTLPLLFFFFEATKWFLSFIAA
jgi:hypothetical protein